MMTRHNLVRPRWFAARDTIALLGLAVALLLPPLAPAQGVSDVLGLYRGFAQSNIDPTIHPSMELTVDRQDGSDFFGTLLMGAPLPFAFQGKVDAAGGVKGKGTGAAGEVRFSGHIQDLGDQGGALVLATYKFTPATGGPVDQGVTNLLRSYPPEPCQPPDPCEPPDIAGSWEGTSASDVSRRQETLALEISQDGTSFEGFEIVGGIIPCVIVGTVGVGGNFVYIGVGDPGLVLVGGQFLPTPNDGLDARYSRNFATGAVDLGTFTVRPLDR